MKHCILVKFNDDFDFLSSLVDIKKIFNSLDKDVVSDVEVILNCIDRENRYDLLIRLTLDKDKLPLYDESSAHKKWKDHYSTYILKKAIFDYEE